MGKAIVSLFSGCGGLDLGFCQAGFDVIWANEYDRDIWQTYENNHPDTLLDKRDIREISSSEIPECVGIIGGPPCQSWSEAGTQRGIDDDRGRLFLEYVRILKDKQPLFFLAENVSGMLHKKHRLALSNIIAAFEEAGYVISFKLLNAKHYKVPQDRKRVIFVGYHVELGKRFNFDYLKSEPYVPTLRDVIWDLRESAIPALGNNKTQGEACSFPNHEYMTGGFSSIYMSRNRVRSWDEPSFTIQAGGRHAPIHPQANKMLHVGKDKWIFDPNSLNSYRRLSIRECSRMQTFPDSFTFYYQNLTSGYKMIGNAVPVNLSYALARTIDEDLFNHKQEVQENQEAHRSIAPIQVSLVFS
jgi:DNA (cytosine-5)-methyltransferase 1